MSQLRPELEFPGKDLGRGSFARVEQASLLGTTVAVKKMKIARAARVRRLAMKEVEVHSRLHHPKIVQLMGGTGTLDYFRVRGWWHFNL